MSKERSGPEQEFFVTGAETWLDVEDAIVEFRRQAQQRCREVVEPRLRDISDACKMEWKADQLLDFRERTADWGCLGQKLRLGSVARLYFYLIVYRDASVGPYGAHVCLWRARSNIATSLWSLAQAQSKKVQQEGNSLYVGPMFSEVELFSFEQHLNKAIEHFISFIGKAGGLKKHFEAETAATA